MDIRVVIHFLKSTDNNGRIRVCPSILWLQPACSSSQRHNLSLVLNRNGRGKNQKLFSLEVGPQDIRLMGISLCRLIKLEKTKTAPYWRCTCTYVCVRTHTSILEETGLRKRGSDGVLRTCLSITPLCFHLCGFPLTQPHAWGDRGLRL